MAARNKKPKKLTRYLVDGSNVLFRLASCRSDREQEAGRRKVARLCAGLAARQKAKIVLYFDGEDRLDLKDFHDRGVAIRYTGRHTADALIIYALKKLGDVSTTCVITDDGGLARRATKVGAAVQGAEALLLQPHQTPRKESLSRGEIAFLEKVFTQKVR